MDISARTDLPPCAGGIPGSGVGISGPEGAAQLAAVQGYVEVDGVVTVVESNLSSQRRLLTCLHNLLTATANRPARLGYECDLLLTG